MCGRFLLRAKPDEIAEHFELQSEPLLEPRYNIAPTQDAAIVRVAQDGSRELVHARWGLVPFGGPGPGAGPLMINARSETAEVKSPFRSSLEHRRCIVPADGFYEWRKLDRVRQPYLIHLGGRLFGFAGLWDEWRSKAGEHLVSFAILTTDPAPAVAFIHDRMPVMLDRGDYAPWLRPSPGTDAVVELLHPYRGADLTTTAVSDAVNAVQNDGPECVREVPEPLELDLFS